MKRKLLLPLLSVPLLAGCSYFMPSHDQKNFKVDSPPQNTVTPQKTEKQDKKEAEDLKKSAKSESKEKKKAESLPEKSASQPMPPQEEVLSGNQPQHHISAFTPDPTALEDNSNPTLRPDGTVSAPVVRSDHAPALSARQQERQAAIKLRDSLERIQNGHANNSEEDRQLSELPSSQRRAMLEQLNQALAK